MLRYTVEVKDWDNLDSYPVVYKGNDQIVALLNFKEYHLNGFDVIMYTEDQEGNTLDTLENFHLLANIASVNEMFLRSNSAYKK